MDPDDRGVLRQQIERTMWAARVRDEEDLPVLCDQLTRWILSREYGDRPKVLMGRYWPPPPVAQDLAELCQAYDDICNAPILLLRAGP